MNEPDVAARVPPDADDEPASGSRPGFLHRAGPDLAAVATLLLFAIAFFSPLLTGHMFSTVGNVQNGIYPWAATPNALPAALQDDSATLNFGWQAFLTETIRGGSFPFWGPGNFGGYALFANGSAGYGNPLRLLLALAVPPAVAHELFSLFHLGAGGILAYVLGRELRLSRWGSLFVGTAWMLSSWNLGWLHLEVVSPVIAFFPAVLLLIRRAARSPNLAWTALAGAVMAWLLVSAHLLFALVTWYIAVAAGIVWAVWPFVARVERDGRAALGRLSRALGAAVLSVGLAAPVLLPTWRMLGTSQREPVSYDALRSRWLTEPSTFLYSLRPPPLPLSTEDFNTDLVFLGSATGVLALIALAGARRRPATLLGGALVVGIFLVVVGTPLTRVVFELVPGMDVFRPYGRLAMWWGLGLALLGGAGLDVVSQWLRRWRHSMVPAVAVVLIGLTALQLLAFGRAVNPPFPPRDSALLFPPTPLLSALDERADYPNGWPVRHVGIRGSQRDGWSPAMLFANTNLAAGHDSITGYDSAIPDRSSDVIRVLAGARPDEVLATGLQAAYAPVIDADTGRLELLGRMGVGVVAVVPGLVDSTEQRLLLGGGVVAYEGADGTLVELADAGPRLVGGTTVEPDRRAALLAFTGPGFDHTATALIEDAELARLGDAVTLPDRPGSGGSVQSAERDVNGARIVVDAQRASWLVVPDAWAPGWTASVGGRDATVVRVNYYQRAVFVEAGRSEVVLTYRPDGWSLGVVIGAFSALGAAALVAAPLIRRRRRARSSRPVALR